MTTERSATEDRAEYKDKIIDWVRKKVENPEEHEVKDQIVNVMLNDFTEITMERAYTIPEFFFNMG